MEITNNNIGKSKKYKIEINGKIFQLSEKDYYERFLLIPYLLNNKLVINEKET